MLTLILFIFILGIIVLIHEGGHFLFAKLVGVHVYEFSIGMGPKLIQKIAKDGTKYSIRAIPIGGFVSLAGEEIDEKELEKTKGSNLQDKPIWQRFLVMFMGVGFNFVFAFLILILSGLIYGAPDTKPVLTDVVENYPAYNAGLKSGDEVVRINGHKITYKEDISLYLAIENLDKPVAFEVIREDGSTATYNVQAVKEKTDDTERYVVGIVMGSEAKRGLIPSIVYGVNESFAIFKQMYVVLGNLFTGGVSVNQLSGPVGIYTVVGQMQNQGINALIYLMALLSINVGVINLLPLPAFDGGRILFLIIEKIKGKPVSPKVENTIHSIGFILLILLMLYVTFNDILRLF
jgi:regulator of sigma E protease